MTRSQAAQRLLALRNLRDAKDACEMGARAIQDEPLARVIWTLVGLVAGFILGVIGYAA